MLGVLGPEDTCPSDSAAHGFRLRFAPFEGRGYKRRHRNAGVTGIHLLCRQLSTRPGTRPPAAADYISSNEAFFGEMDYTFKTCAAHSGGIV